MNTITQGSAVACGICGKDTKVSFVTEREGGQAFDLECFHRNGYCETCDKLVPDTSETIYAVKPHCPTCSGPIDEPEELDE
jgi:hypothetical protein